MTSSVQCRDMLLEIRLEAFETFAPVTCSRIHYIQPSLSSNNTLIDKRFIEFFAWIRIQPYIDLFRWRVFNTLSQGTRKTWLNAQITKKLREDPLRQRKRERERDWSSWLLTEKLFDLLVWKVHLMYELAETLVGTSKKITCGVWVM